MLQRIVDWTSTDWVLKLTALLLAFLLWVSVQADAPGQWAPENIRVRVINTDPGWVATDRTWPDSVTVVFRGPYGELIRAASNRPYVIVPVEDVQDSVEVRELLRDWVVMPPGLEQTQIIEFRPSTIRITFDRVSTRLIPVAATVTGQLPDGFTLTGPVTVEPDVVRASGPARSLARIDSLRLPALDLSGRRRQDTMQLTIDTTGTGLIITPRTVRVIVPVQPAGSSTAPMSLKPPPPSRSGG